MTGRSEALEKDPICGMVVPKSTALRSAREGKTYYFCSTHCQHTFEAKADLKHRQPEAATHRQHGHGQSEHRHHEHGSKSGRGSRTAIAPSADKMAKDPICGMMIPKATALHTERGGRTYYFCSQNCQNTFLDPERELKTMRSRVAAAMAGILMLAVLRAAAFLGLAAGVTLVTEWQKRAYY